MRPTISDVRLLTFKLIRDNRGILVPIEGERDFPFAIRRIFIVQSMAANQQRGSHAHRTGKQLLVCVSGVCEVRCYDGQGEARFELSQADHGLYIPPRIWAEQTYRDDNTTLLVLCDSPYDDADYICDLDAFHQFIEATA